MTILQTETRGTVVQSGGKKGPAEILPTSPDLPVAFGLEDALRVLVGTLPGVVRVRLLEASSAPKVFIVTGTHDLERDEQIVMRMIQIEDIKPNVKLQYDLVPEQAEHFVPALARDVLRA